MKNQILLIGILLIIPFSLSKAIGQSGSPCPIDEQSVSIAHNGLCPDNTGTTVSVSSSQIGVDYYLRDNNDNTVIAGPIAGTGSGITFQTGAIGNNATYNVYALAGAGAGDEASVYFSGNAMISGPNGPGITGLGQTGFTLEAWVNPVNVSGVLSIIRKTGDYNLYMYNGAVYAEVWPTPGSSSWRLISSGLSVQANTWTHVAFTWNGSSHVFYINGVPSTGSVSTGSIGGFENLNIGRSAIYGQSFYGYIDEIRVWNDVRTQAEISDDMGTCLSGTEDNLQCYFQMDEGTGNTIYDISSNAYTASLNAVGWETSGAIACDTGCELQMSALVSVTVSDTEPPFIVTHDFTAELNAAGMVTLIPENVATVTDNCALDTVSVYPDEFYCGDIGFQPVTITARDASGSGPTGNYVNYPNQLNGLQNTFMDKGDVDLDGDIDVVVTSNFYLNNGDGTSFVFQNLANDNCTGPRLGDIDGDGDLDLVTNRYVFKWNGSSMGNTQTFSENNPIFGNAVLADLDNDGDLDYYAPTYYTEQERIYLNDGAGNMSLGNAYSIGSFQICATSGDFDGDGDIDIVCAGYYDVYYAENDGAANLSYSSIHTNGNDYITRIRSTDLNGDGDLDIVWSGSAYPVQYMLGNGDGSFQPPVSIVNSGFSWSIDLADFEGDGDIDILNVANGPILLLKNDGNANFTADTTGFLGGVWALGAGYYMEGILSDFNNDGVSDLAFSRWGPGVVALSEVSSGNVSTATATVTVVDNLPPEVTCQDASIVLDQYGFASLDPSELITPEGATDNCGIASISVSQDEFTCADLGENNVTLTVTDLYGNFTSCEAIVTVEDQIAPEAICQDITVQLDASGFAEISAEDIDNGSNDVCGIASLEVSPESFDCSHIGQNLVTLTVTDNGGNVSSCQANVTVEDITPPVITLQGDNPLVVTRFSGAFEDPGVLVSDNCDPEPVLNLSGAVNTNLPGDYLLTYTAVDMYGNIAEETRMVIVIDDPNALDHQYLYFADKKIMLDKMGQSVGDMHSNDEIDIKKGPVTYISNITAVDKIDIDQYITIDGDVTAGGELQLSNNVTITGTAIAYGNVSSIALPQLSFNAGGVNIEVKKNKTKILTPGSYGKVKVEERGALKLTSGVYYFEELEMKKKSDLEISLTNGPVTINVEEEVKFKTRVDMILLPLGEADSRYVTFNSMEDIEADKKAHLLGSFVAPEGKVKLKKNVYLKGSVCAGEIDIDKSAKAFFHIASVNTSQGIQGEPQITDDDLAQDEVLKQNYPNPFATKTSIEFNIEEEGVYMINIFNLNGLKIAELARDSYEPGAYTLTYHADHLQPGIYFYQLLGADPKMQVTRKMVKVR